MASWTKLDLASSWGKPAPEQLVALRKVPANSRDTLYRAEAHDIGCFKPDPRNPSSRKLWWYGTHGCQDPMRMKKHYDIWWYPVMGYDDL